VVERDISRSWIARPGLIAGPSRCLDPTQMNLLMLGHLKDHVYMVRPRTVEDRVARLEAALTTVDVNMFKICSREWLAGHCRLPCNGLRPP
jgi:hypothetical protein